MTLPKVPKDRKLITFRVKTEGPAYLALVEENVEETNKNVYEIGMNLNTAVQAEYDEIKNLLPGFCPKYKESFLSTERTKTNVYVCCYVWNVLTR